jgi:diketogulonate reductase-like aldo/keto reductase
VAVDCLHDVCLLASQCSPVSLSMTSSPTMSAYPPPKSCRPGFLVNAFSNDAYLDGLVQCKQQGLCDAIGVSNFNANRVRGAAARLAKDGCVLASNQVCVCAESKGEGGGRGNVGTASSA